MARFCFSAMKKILLSSLVFFSFPFLASAATFSDVPGNHAFYAAVESLKNLEIVKGFDDGTFRPNNPVTRAEALKMILTSAQATIEGSSETEFSDVPADAWFGTFVRTGRNLKIVNGYGNTGKFGPNDRVQKSQFLKMLLLAFRKDVSKHENLKSGVSADTAPGQWWLSYMSYSKTLGIITPNVDNKLFPEKELTRGECAEIIYRLLVLERGGETQKMLSMAESHLVNILVNLSANNIEAALTDAKAATDATGRALQLSPNEGIVKAADKIARGFSELSLAYKAGLSNDNEGLRQHAEAAKSLAGQAFSDDASTQALGKKIKTQADALLSQIAPEGAGK